MYLFPMVPFSRDCHIMLEMVNHYCALQISCLGRDGKWHLSMSLYKQTAFGSCSIQRLTGWLKDNNRVENYSCKHNWPQQCVIQKFNYVQVVVINSTSSPSTFLQTSVTKLCTLEPLPIYPFHRKTDLQSTVSKMVYHRDSWLIWQMVSDGSGRWRQGGMCNSYQLDGGVEFPQNHSPGNSLTRAVVVSHELPFSCVYVYCGQSGK